MALSYPPDTFGRQKGARAEFHARGAWGKPRRPGKACTCRKRPKLPIRIADACAFLRRGPGKEEPMEVTLAAIEQARRAISGAILRTPLLTAPRLSALI